MVKFFFTLSMCLALADVLAQGIARNIYFETDSFRLSFENIALLEKTFAETPPGNKINFRILIHEDVKNKVAINELDRKRSQELYDYFIAEGVSPNNLKPVKTPGREAKGFISDEMKGLLIYDLEVFKANPAVDFTAAPDLVLPDGPAENFEMEASKGKTIQTKGGLKIQIPPHAFLFKNGLAPASPVSLRIREYLHPGQMAASGLSTQLNESQLKAIYLLYIEGSSAGHALRLQKGSTITISCTKPPEDQSNFELYHGLQEAAAFSLIQPVPPVPARVESTSLLIVSSHLKWIACATSPNNATANLTVKLPAKFNLTVGLIIENEHMICRAYTLAGGKETGFGHLPAGQKATLFAYGINEGKVYFYTKTLQTSAGAKEKILLKESSMDEIGSLLAGLDKE